MLRRQSIPSTFHKRHLYNHTTHIAHPNSSFHCTHVMWHSLIPSISYRRHSELTPTQSNVRGSLCEANNLGHEIHAAATLVPIIIVQYNIQ